MSHVCVIGTRGVPGFVGGVETICQKLYPLMIRDNPSYKISLSPDYPTVNLHPNGATHLRPNGAT